MWRSWPPPPSQSSRLCALMHPQEAAASSGETTAQGGDNRQCPGSAGRCPMSRWMAALCPPSSPQPLEAWAVTKICSGPRSDSALAVEGEEKTQRTGSALDSERVSAWAARFRRGAGGTSRADGLWRAVEVDIENKRLSRGEGGRDLFAVRNVNKSSVEIVPPILMLLLLAGPLGI